MALALQELPINGYIRRTPPAFVPISDPNPAPLRSVAPVRVVAPAIVADELPPCRCRRCHRLLRSAPSIAAGIGPACARREGMAPTALPLFDGLEVA